MDIENYTGQSNIRISSPPPAASQSSQYYSIPPRTSSAGQRQIENILARQPSPSRSYPLNPRRERNVSEIPIAPTENTLTLYSSYPKTLSVGQRQIENILARQPAPSRSYPLSPRQERDVLKTQVFYVLSSPNQPAEISITTRPQVCINLGIGSGTILLAGAVMWGVCTHNECASPVKEVGVVLTVVGASLIGLSCCVSAVAFCCLCR